MTKWIRASYGCIENPGVFDTGNGGIATIEVSADCPGIERVTVRSYCARADNYRYYRREADAAGAFVRDGAPAFGTLAEARQAMRR